MELPDPVDRAQRLDPFSKLEAGNEDARRGWEARDRLASLYADSAAKHRDNYGTNKALRAAMRCAPAVPCSSSLLSGRCLLCISSTNMSQLCNTSTSLLHYSQPVIAQSAQA